MPSKTLEEGGNVEDADGEVKVAVCIGGKGSTVGDDAVVGFRGTAVSVERIGASVEREDISVGDAVVADVVVGRGVDSTSGRIATIPRTVKTRPAIKVLRPGTICITAGDTIPAPPRIRKIPRTTASSPKKLRAVLA